MISFEKIVTGTFLTICALGLGKYSYNFVHRETIFDSKVMQIKTDSHRGETGYPVIRSINISVDKYVNCVNFKGNPDIRIGDQLEKMVIKYNLIGCDEGIEYAIKNRGEKN